MWWVEGQTCKTGGTRGGKLASVGFISQRRDTRLCSKRYRKPGEPVIRSALHFYILRCCLWLQGGEWIVKGQEQKEGES